MQKIEYLTAETPQGREAIAQVMAHSFQTDFGTVPQAWALVRCVMGEPVSFALVDPRREMQYPGGCLRYAFLADIATSKERRWEGHFRGLMEEIFRRLIFDGCPLLVTHGRYPLYRRYGFDVFTYNSGVWVTPDMVEFRLGALDVTDEASVLEIAESHFIKNDLLLVTRAWAVNEEDARRTLRAAAWRARQAGKGRILIEEPPAPSYGSSYPIYTSPETPLTRLARAIGGEVWLQGANPEAGGIPDADWIRTLDPLELLRQALDCRQNEAADLPEVGVWFEIEGMGVLLETGGGKVKVSSEKRGDPVVIRWPGAALAQLVTGYQPASMLAVIYRTPVPGPELSLLETLFPPYWRFSRNESWTYTT